jgi:hypothetical protein
MGPAKDDAASVKPVSSSVDDLAGKDLDGRGEPGVAACSGA